MENSSAPAAPQPPAAMPNYYYPMPMMGGMSLVR